MKLVASVLLLGLCATASAQQNLPEYTASNNVTFHIGDTVKLGRGSGNNGVFVYIVGAGLAQAGPLPSRFASGNAVIKKIQTWKEKGAAKYVLVVGVGLATNYYIYIGDAIATCEVTPCASTTAQDDKLDQLQKLKGLLDSGALTQEEYDAEKKKILGN